LLFVGNIKYELSKEYYEILSQIFMRDELRISNMALGQVMEEVEEKIEALFSLGQHHLSFDSKEGLAI